MVSRSCAYVGASGIRPRGYIYIYTCATLVFRAPLMCVGEVLLYELGIVIFSRRGV